MMKMLFRIRYKASLAIILTIIITAIAANNLLSRRNYNELAQSFETLYKDRLLAATYLYGISYHLHEKHNLLGCAVTPNNSFNIQQHNTAIEKLRRQFEATTLTQSEADGWKHLTVLLERYNALEKRMAMGDIAAGRQLEQVFRQSLGNLQDLTNIQAAEGSSISKQSRTIFLNGTAIGTAEISLLIVLGLIAIAIAGITDDKLFRNNGSQMWN